MSYDAGEGRGDEMRYQVRAEGRVVFHSDSFALATIEARIIAARDGIATITEAPTARVWTIRRSEEGR